MDRKYLLPASAVALSFTTGCSKGIVGDWLATTFDDGDTFYELPQVYTETDEGVTYTYTEGMRLLVQDDGRAAFGGYYVYSGSDGSYEREEYLKSGTWAKSGGTFLLEFEDDNDEIDLNCTLDGADMLTCDFESTHTYEDYGDNTPPPVETRGIVTFVPRETEE